MLPAMLGAQGGGATEGRPFVLVEGPHLGPGPEKLAAGEGTGPLRYPAPAVRTVSEASPEGLCRAPPHQTPRSWAPPVVEADARRDGEPEEVGSGRATTHRGAACWRAGQLPPHSNGQRWTPSGSAGAAPGGARRPRLSCCGGAQNAGMRCWPSGGHLGEGKGQAGGGAGGGKARVNSSKTVTREEGGPGLHRAVSRAHWGCAKASCSLRT